VDAFVEYLYKYEDVNLQNINLSQNNINDSQVAKIFAAMQESKHDSLRKIKLRRNKLTDKTAFAL
jgi:hypothetical protein